MTMTHRTGEDQELPSVFRTAIGSTEEAVNCAARCQQELARFSSMRMSRYLDIPQDLRTCHGPVDIFNFQMEFLAKTHADYLNVSSRIMEALFDIQAASRGGNGERGQEKYGRAILKAQKDAEKIIELARSQAARIIADAEARSAAKTSLNSAAVEEQRHVA